MKKLYIDYNPYLVRAALAEDDKLIEFSVERASVRGLVGNIYKGRVENVLSGMKAAFVNIGLERNGFLYVGDSLVDNERLKTGRQPTALNVSPGDVIMCQVVKDQFGLKGARLTTDITIPAFYLVLLPGQSFIGVSRKIEDEERRAYLEELVRSVCPENTGFIIRSAADKARDDDIKREAAALLGIWKRVTEDYKRADVMSTVFKEAELLVRAIRDNFSEEVDSIIVNDAGVAAQLEGKLGSRIELYEGERNIMRHFGLSNEIKKLADRRVELGNGAYIVIDKTEALTVIDVNTGRFVGTSDLEDTVFRTNLLASEAIARQLRLRNIGGIVVIDFIDMTDENHREAVLEKLRSELKKDTLKTSAVAMTGLGLVELTRKKTRLPVDAFLLEACKDCMGGFVPSEAHLAFEMRDELIEYTLSHKQRTIKVKMNPELADFIFETRIFSREAKGVWRNRRIYVLGDASLKRGEFTIEATDDKVVSLPNCARLLTW